MTPAWGLRGRWFRRLIAAWIIGLSTTAAIADDSCCCCCDGGPFGAMVRLTAPDLREVDPIAQRHLRDSAGVRGEVGEITTVEIDDVLPGLGMQQVFTHDSDEGTKTVYEIRYRVVGAAGTAVFTVYVVKRAGQWVAEAINGPGVEEGTIPDYEVSSGGDWD